MENKEGNKDIDKEETIKEEDIKEDKKEEKTNKKPSLLERRKEKIAKKRKVKDEKANYIFPEFISKGMAKIDLRTQLEASMFSMSLLCIGIIVTVIYFMIYTDFKLWYKIFLGLNCIAGVMFMASNLVTTFQQYKTYMAAKKCNEDMKTTSADVGIIDDEEDTLKVEEVFPYGTSMEDVKEDIKFSESEYAKISPDTKISLNENTNNLIGVSEVHEINQINPLLENTKDLLSKNTSKIKEKDKKRSI